MSSLVNLNMNSTGFASGTVLIVEDDQLMTDLLQLYLKEANFKFLSVDNAEKAWEILNDDKLQFDCVLLDRNLPGMSGLELLKQIKSSKKFMDLPVIIETAEVSDTAILEGLNNGAYYYLTKPVEKVRLISTLKASVSDYRRHHYLKNEVKGISSIFRNCQEGIFKFRTLLDSQRMAIALANVFPQPERAISGLSELMTNAVEHGNLEIGYQKKSQLLEQELLIDEIDERLEQDVFASRFGTIRLQKDNEKVEVTISDQGNGFNWEPCLTLSIERVFDQHGRGIAMAREISFDKVEYQGSGNTVICTTYL